MCHSRHWLVARAVHLQFNFRIRIKIAQHAPTHEQINFYYSNKTAKWKCLTVHLPANRFVSASRQIIIIFICAVHVSIRQSASIRKFRHGNGNASTFTRFTTIWMGCMARESNWKRRNNWNYTHTFFCAKLFHSFIEKLSRTLWHTTRRRIKNNTETEKIEEKKTENNFPLLRVTAIQLQQQFSPFLHFVRASCRAWRAISYLYRPISIKYSPFFPSSN